MRFSIFLGDIADAPADALCTSTNPRLSLMMGTGASVRARGGPAVMRACEGLPNLLPGMVHATTAGNLPHKIAIHCVASDASHRSSSAIVESCVANALASADAAGCTTIAIPILGTGHARLRFADAVRAMARSAAETPTRVERMIFVTNDEENVPTLRAILERAEGLRSRSSVREKSSRRPTASGRARNCVRCVSARVLESEARSVADAGPRPRSSGGEHDDRCGGGVMKTYKFSEARQNLAALLDEAASTGEVRISRRDGHSFVLRPVKTKRSPLDVPGIDSGLSGADIVKTVREGRRRVR
jgi:O-acetyl-ADP-ribose deacetylase (regulator of RNase III)